MIDCILDPHFYRLKCRIRDSVHRKAMWRGNADRIASWRIRKNDIGYMPAPVLVERWRPSILWRLRRLLGVS